MKRATKLDRNLWVRGALSADSRSSSWLVHEGRGRRPRWVLRWILRRASGPLRQELRSDLGRLACLSHPALAIPAAFRTDAETRRSFVLRPHVDGAEISAALRGVPPETLPVWLFAAAEALATLHCSGFAHGAVKSSNLLVPRSALFSRGYRGPRVVLCDPCLWPGEEGASGMASDLRALGGVFYWLLTGRAPEAGPSGFPRSPSELNPSVPVDVDRVVLKLLQRDSAKSYRDAGALSRDLRLLVGPSAATGPGPECFVGREAELAQCIAQLEQPGRVCGFAVVGRAGMGKSAVLRRLVLEAGLLDYLPVSVRCYEESALPLRAIREIVDSLIPEGKTGRRLRSTCRRLFDTPPKARDAFTPDSTSKSFVRALREVLNETVQARRVLLLVDDAHLADPLTIELLASLLRGADGEEDRCSISLVVAFREDEPFREAVKPLLDALRPGIAHRRVEVGPLPESAVREWIRSHGSSLLEAREEDDGGPFDDTSPFAVREALRGAGGASDASSSTSQVFANRVRALGGAGRRIAESLAVLGRPATVELLAKASSTSEGEARRALDALARRGIVTPEPNERFFCLGSFHLALLDEIPATVKRKLHRAIAESLESGASSVSAREAAHHWLESDLPARGLRLYLAAARELVRGHEDKRALRFFDAALRIIQRRSVRWRAVGEEAANACLRAGEHRKGLTLVDSLLAQSRKWKERGRLHLRQGVLRHRVGELDLAVEHLERGLAGLEREKSIDGARERLWAEAELAEISINRGDYARADVVTRRALDLLAEAQLPRSDPGIRRAEMVLLGTLAHLSLRRFEYSGALEHFRRSLEAAQGLEPLPETSLIYNNLGTLHGQQNRFLEAIESYERAEEISAELEDDQCLAAVLSNLAMLYARTGNPEAAERALRKAARHEGRCDSPRIRFLRLHSAGIARITLGHYEEALPLLEAAVALGAEINDLHLTAFDWVFLGECQLFRGELRAAAAALGRSLRADREPPAPVPSMVEARRAAIAALRGNDDDLRASLKRFAERPSVSIAYVDAWNRVFLGWAHRLSGDGGLARAELERALQLFSSAKVSPGEAHASIELAAVDRLEGRAADAERRLEVLRGRFRQGGGPLANPMLAARALLEQARLCLERSPTALEEAASHLVEAESYMIGRSLGDLESQARELRRRLGRFEADGSSPKSMDPRAAGKATDARAGAGALTGASTNVLALDRIVGDSHGILRLKGMIRQMAQVAAPVLITGETGTGKEMVARAIHAEGPRRTGPFVSLNCAALPAELIEAELFGHVRGAFTGAETDNPGLLRTARGGVFFFDEVGELAPELQAKLLRVLDRSKVRRVGGSEEFDIDVRFVFATSRDLGAQSQKGIFRSDLLFRIGALELRVPPLREHVEDIPLLVEHFTTEAIGAGSAVALDDGALKALAAHPWPGNTRELRNFVVRLSLMRSGRIHADDVKINLGAPRKIGLFASEVLRSRPIGELLHELEREHLIQLCLDLGGDLKEAAKCLKISLRALYDRLKRLRIKPEELR